MSDAADARLDELAQAYVRRLRAGEPVTPADYAAEHPDLAERIEEVFPVLALVEGLKTPEPGSAPATEPGPGAGGTEGPARIGPFRVVRPLGHGGMGRVYEVRDEHDLRRALKVVHPHLLEREGFLARFLREIETGLRVEHPGVVRTLASGVAEIDEVETPWVLLEFVEGETLRDLLEETGGVSERLARDIGLAMAEALAAVHDADVVHRDVKPENVILGPDESIKLMDLGVALVQDEALRLTHTGEFVGSLLYAAPEQLQQGHVDARADLYALGLVLYELLAGRHPETTGSGPVLAQKLGPRRVPRLREVVPHATPFFERVLQTLLAPAPAERFDSARELARVLREGEEGAWWVHGHRGASPAGRPRRGRQDVAFVGREAERAALDEAFARAREGRGQVRVVRGEAGIGKSRLLTTWLDDLEARGASPAVLWMEHAPGSSAIGVTPLARALHAQLGEDAEARVRTWLGERGDRAGEVLAALAEAADPVGGGGLAGTALEAMILQLIRGLAAERPLVVVVEDLHFATPEGRALFERLAHACVADPVLLIGTTRPVEPEIPGESLAALEHAAVIDVPPLGEDATLSLLRAGLGEDDPPLEAMRALVRISDGNPYCLLAFARDVRERGGDPGADVVLPRSVRRLVDARLRALDTEERELLSLAACSGHRFDPRVVCEAGGLPRLAGLRQLHRLERRGGLIEAEGTDYRFHHHLVQEALQAELPPALRSAYHAALGEACERRLPTDRPPTGEEAHALARHFLRGDAPARAQPHVLAGIEHLVAHAEGRRAERMARTALEALPDAPPALRAHLQYQRGRAMDGHAPPAEIVEVLEGALALARETGETELELDVLQSLGAAVSHTGRHADAAGISARAVERAEQVGDAFRQARARTSHATSLYNLGDPEAAFACGRKALALAREAGAARQAGQTATILAALYAEAGLYDEARPLAEMGLSVTHLHGDRGAEHFVSSVLAKLARIQGDLEGAHALLERSRAVGRELGNLRLALGTEIGMTQVRLDLGHAEEVLAATARMLGVCERMGYHEIGALLSVPRALAASALGKLATAAEAAAHAQDLLARVPLPAIAARTLPTVAHVLAWMGAFEEAEQAIARGLAAADQARYPREAVQLRQAAAGLLDAQGETEAAAEAYAQALAEARAAHLDLAVAQIAARLGGLEARLGRPAEARAHLDEALAVAERGPVPGLAAECGLWLDLLPEGNPARARIALERDAHVLPARARLRLWVELARQTGEASAREEARRLATALIEAAPEARREVMRAAVPLYGEALA